MSLKEAGFLPGINISKRQQQIINSNVSSRLHLLAGVSVLILSWRRQASLFFGKQALNSTFGDGIIMRHCPYSLITMASSSSLKLNHYKLLRNINNSDALFKYRAAREEMAKKLAEEYLLRKNGNHLKYRKYQQNLMVRLWWYQMLISVLVVGSERPARNRHRYAR